MRPWHLAAPALTLAFLIPFAHGDEPMSFAPDEIARPDGGAAADPTPPPSVTQAQDREAPPMPGSPAPPPTTTPPTTTPPPATTPTTPAPEPAVVAPPKITRAAKPKAKVSVAAQRAPIIPPRITVHAWEPEKATLFVPEETVESAMSDALAQDKRLRLTPFDALLGSDEAQPKLAQADNDSAEADKAILEMDLDHAQALLESALKTYQRYLPDLAARPDAMTPMSEAWIKMSRVRFFQGNQDGARDALRYAFVLDRKLTFKKERFPPQMKKLVVEARLLFDTLGPGKLTIDSDPPGATLWLDGNKLAQPAPTDPLDAPPGPNYISFARRGYAPMTLVFEVGGGGDAARAGQTLERYPQNPLAPIDRARAHIDDARAPATLQQACAMLSMDMLLLLRLERPGLEPDEKPTAIVAYLYDARPDKVIKKLERPVTGDLGEAARQLAVDMMSDVPLDGMLVPPPPPRRPSWASRLVTDGKRDLGRFYRWKGFWYVVGGVAALAVAGIAGGVGGEHAIEEERLARQRQLGTGVILIGGN